MSMPPKAERGRVERLAGKYKAQGDSTDCPTPTKEKRGMICKKDTVTVSPFKTPERSLEGKRVPRYHDKCVKFEQLTFGCFRRLHGPIWMPSYYDFTDIKDIKDGIARALRSRVAFVRQSGSFVSPSYCHREAKMPDGTDGHTKYRRRLHDVMAMASRWPYEGQDGHTNSTRR
jgi:hypothetical protein